MASDPPKRRSGSGEKPSDEDNNRDDNNRMETFSYDVSASETKKPGKALNSPAPEIASKSTKSKKKKSPRGKTAGAVPAKEILTSERPSAKLPAGSKIAAFDEPSAAPIDRAEVALDAQPGNTEATPASGRRRIPSWLASLAVHGLLVLLLSLYALPALRKNEDFGLSASAASVEEVDEFQEIEIDPSEDLDSLDAEMASELADPGAASFGDLSAESALSDVTGDTALLSDSLGDMGTLFGESGSGLSDLGKGLGGATASFFGSKVQAKRIVYVLDNSGGMRYGELETLVSELLKSVDSLAPKQQFYVIFYSDALYPLFYPEAPQNFVRANDKNKLAIRRWLDSVEFCLGNVVDDAVRAALTIRPDVVYLLTDGDLDGTKDQRRMKFLLFGTGGAIPIHTIGMGTGETGTAATKLKQVAEANGGTFRAVDIATEAKQLAKNKARPYHNKGPGSVWGRSVREK